MRYNRWVRKLLIKISYIVPERIAEAIAEYLYPDDMMITFK